MRSIVVFLTFSNWMLCSILNGDTTTTNFNIKMTGHKIILLVKTAFSEMEYIHFLTVKDCYLSLPGRNLTFYPEGVCSRFHWNNSKLIHIKLLLLQKSQYSHFSLDSKQISAVHTELLHMQKGNHVTCICARHYKIIQQEVQCINYIYHINS